MMERFVEVDRDTPMLLPADLRAWVPEDDLLHFVLEAVGTLSTGDFWSMSVAPVIPSTHPR